MPYGAGYIPFYDSVPGRIEEGCLLQAN